jgi:hypothetical protein
VQYEAAGLAVECVVRQHYYQPAGGSDGAKGGRGGADGVSLNVVHSNITRSILYEVQRGRQGAAGAREGRVAARPPSRSGEDDAQSTRRETRGVGRRARARTTPPCEQRFPTARELTTMATSRRRRSSWRGVVPCQAERREAHFLVIGADCMEEWAEGKTLTMSFSEALIRGASVHSKCNLIVVRE